MSDNTTPQIQALNDILDNNNLQDYFNEGINVNHFTHYEDEFNFIVNHFNKYGKVPDLLTFGVNFKDFEVVKVTEPVKYIIDELRESYGYTKGVNIFQESAKILEGNSYEGLENIVTKSQQLLNELQDIRLGDSITDLKDGFIEKIKSRREMNNEGLIGISSGFEEIDRITHGWLPGNELVTIVGRVNQGKSWILQKFLSEASKQGKKVLHYSGEMGKDEVLARHITLTQHISNTALMTGDLTDEEIKSIKFDNDNYHIVIPKDINGRLTITMLRTLINKYQPDIVGIDQLSLMKDERATKGDTTKIKYANISQDLFNLSCELNVPILLAVQANRGKTSEDKLESPNLSNIADSDDVSQNSSRTISLAQLDGELELRIVKNRFGNVNDKFNYIIDLDKGQFKNKIKPRNSINKQNEKYTDKF